MNTSFRVLLASNSAYAAESEFENFSRFLAAKDSVQVTTISHPLLRRQKHRTTTITRYLDSSPTEHRIQRRLGPPVSYLSDYRYFRHLNQFDVVIGFNPIQTFLARRSKRENGLLVNWAIDFVPGRHYPPVARSVYVAVDRWMVGAVDLLIENNEFALNARLQRSKRIPLNSMIVPITVDESWFESGSANTPIAPVIIYVGSINSRNGIPFLLRVISKVLAMDTKIHFRVIGDGQLLSSLRQQVADLRIEKSVEIYGHVSDEQLVLQQLQGSTVAVAPYAHDPDSFTQFADPQKLKWYAAAGLPMVVSPEPPSASALQAAGAAVVLPAESDKDVADWAEILLGLVGNAQLRQVMSENSRTWATNFSRHKQYEQVWNTLIKMLRTKRGY